MSVVVLAIETSNPSAAVEGSDVGRPGVALGVEQGGAVRVLGVERVRPRGPHHDDLMGAIDRVFAAAGVERRAGKVAVSVGPGGFTSLRIATATASMLAEVWGAELVGVPSARIAAQRVAGSGGRGERFVVALASKSESVWATCFERAPSGAVIEVAPGRICTAAELEGFTGVTTLVGDGFVPESVRQRAAALGWGLERVVLEPAACLEVGVGQPAAAPVMPLYGREAEAVVRWRERKGG